MFLCMQDEPGIVTVSFHYPSSLWVVMVSLLLPISGLPHCLLCDPFCSLPVSSSPGLSLCDSCLAGWIFFFTNLSPTVHS